MPVEPVVPVEDDMGGHTATGPDESPSERGYDTSDLWVTRIIERVGTVANIPALPASVAVFGALPSLGLAGLLVSRWGQLPPGFVAGVLGVGAWLNVAPYLIWRYDSITFPTFVERVTEIISNETDIAALGSEYERLFTRKWPVPSFLTTALGVPMMVLGRPFLRESAGLTVADPLYWVVFGVVLWLGILIGIGLAGVATSILVVREFTKRNFDIDPLHPDGKAGLSAVGALAVRTTVLLSLGSLLLPVQFHYVAVAGNEQLRTLVYLLVAGYAVIIFLSFAVPVFLTNRYAERLREQHLADLRGAYYEAKAESDRLAGVNGASQDRMAAELRAQRLRDEYRTYDNVVLYPTDVAVLSRVAGSVLLPLLFTVLDTFLRRDFLFGATEFLP